MKNLFLSGWAKGNSVPITNSDTNVREFGLKLLFVNLDGSITENLVSFNPDLISDSNWQYAAIPVVGEEAYTSIIVKAVYSYNANTVYFDGIQLFKENFGSSFTYDTNGNVVSVLDLQGQRTLYEYVNNDLTKQIDPNGSVLTYTYDTRHNVLTATTDEGVVYGFEYDTYGNNTAVKVLYNDVPISVTAAYTEDGNRLLSTTDDLGKVTTYNYNENTNVLEWVQYPNDTESSRTTYSYDQMYRIATSSKSVEGLTGGTALTASYTYTNDMLTTIKTGSTTYSFTYGAFAQRSSIQIGSRTLATYSYTNDPNRYLNSIDYGNGDKVQYSYDNQGRVIKETFEDGKSVSYAYDNTGALATVTDSGTGRKTTYHYDLTNRMVKYVETGSNYRHSVGYEYDELNNLTLLVETINGDTHTTSYTYDSDNRITSMATGSISQTIGYDNYGRIATMTMKNGQMSILSTLQTYRSTTTGVPSRQLLTTEITSSTDFLKSTTPHDDNGNIVGIIVTGPGWMDTLIPTSNGTSYIEQISYTYDTANQLVRENNYRTLITSVWEYDNAGNILSRTDYPYTVRPVEFETPIAQDVYHYEDSAWGDLLTGIDNVSFTYDENGNLLNDGYWTYSWEHGRQLSGMTNGTTTWIYTYDAKGMRTSRSNGTDTYTYVYNGNQLSQMTVGNDTLYFTYGVSGPASVTWNDVTYYYALNGQGDVIGIFDASGNCVVTYHWSNAWGWMPYAYGSMASTLGTLNPLRYRGYVYDEETSLYYLNSRYYAPTYGRFISPDVVFDYDAGLQGYNLYAYCGNNPASRVDISGTDSVSVENLDITDDQLSEKEGGGNVYSSPGGSSGSMVGSISYISSKSPASSISPAQVQAVTTGTSNAIGKAGEELAGIDPAAKQSITINGRTRIPDKLTFDALIEVKNVKYISNTLQLRDFAQYATTNHLGLELFVRPTTRIARTIIEAGWNINYLW